MFKQKTNNCWVCNGWNEFHVLWNVGLSDGKQAEVDAANDVDGDGDVDSEDDPLGLLDDGDDDGPEAEWKKKAKVFPAPKSVSVCFSTYAVQSSAKAAKAASFRTEVRSKEASLWTVLAAPKSVWVCSVTCPSSSGFVRSRACGRRRMMVSADKGTAGRRRSSSP